MLLNQNGATKLWVLTSESASDSCDTLSFDGLYSTREKAMEYVSTWYLGTETAATVEWSQPNPENPNFWEGHDPTHRYCFCLTTVKSVDHGVPYRD